MKSLFSLHGLSFNYGHNHVLDDIDLELAGSSFYGLIGANGSGKSTLLELLSGTLCPSAGTVQLHGRDINSYPRKLLATKIAVVPQHFTMDFEYTVREIVLMGRHPHIPRFSSPSLTDLRITEESMEIMDIYHLADRTVNALSGGEMQRVIVARALAQDTEVLILDEATANLDIHHTISIMRVIRKRVNDLGLTVIAAIHDLNLAAAFCDYCVVLKDRNIYAGGKVHDIFTSKILNSVFSVDSAVSYDSVDNSPHIRYKYH